jgi:hypothetical protein
VIEQRRAQGENLPPPPRTAIAGPEYFGLNDPSVVEAIESLDPDHVCTTYWEGKAAREAKALGQGPPPRPAAGAAAAAGGSGRARGNPSGSGSSGAGAGRKRGRGKGGAREEEEEDDGEEGYKGTR